MSYLTYYILENGLSYSAIYHGFKAVLVINRYFCPNKPVQTSGWRRKWVRHDHCNVSSFSFLPPFPRKWDSCPKPAFGDTSLECAHISSPCLSLWFFLLLILVVSGRIRGSLREEFTSRCAHLRACMFSIPSNVPLLAAAEDNAQIC